MTVLDHMRRLEDAGAFGWGVECVAEDSLEEIRKHTKPVISSIGSDAHGDVVFLFMSDLTDETENPPRHARDWGDLRSLRHATQEERLSASRSNRRDVLSGACPDTATTGRMVPGERKKLKEALARRSWQTGRRRAPILGPCASVEKGARSADKAGAD